MAHPTRILVPIDFSENSLIAARHAGALARRFHCEVTLLHVNEFLIIHPLSGPLGFGITSTEAERAEHLTRRRKQLDEFGVAELSGIPVKRLVCCGDPAPIIVDRAHTEKSDLIVMPTHGHGRFRRFLLGSVTAKVLHDAECPVWTGTHFAESPAIDLTEISQVMCAVKFGPQSIAVVRWAADFATEFGASLTVAHVVADLPASVPQPYIVQWNEEARWAAKERLHTLLRDSGVHADVLVVGDGDMPRAISIAAKQKGAGLLVIGRSDARDATKRLGTHTYGTICHAPCPVVTV